jgi:hypothetical protein
MQINFNNIDWTRLGIGFAIQAVFLTIALLVMLKQQKLTWKLPGLLGSVLVACALVQIPYAGAVISFVVLLLCITKVVGARTFTDAIFAVGVSMTLLVVFNLAVLSLLLGVLLPPGSRVRARTAEPAPAAYAAAETNELATTTNAAPAPANAVATPTKPVETNTAVAAAASVPATQTPAVSTNAAAPVPTPDPVFDTNRLNSVRLAGDIMKHFFVKGVSQGATISIAMLSNGTRNFDIVSGDTIQLQTSDGKFAAVKCISITDGQVVISVEGVEVTLYRR